MRCSTWFSICFCLALSLSLAGTSQSYSSPTYYTIEGIDEGGVITNYADKYKALEASGVSVRIDGLCISACTMVLAYFPPDRVCMTERGSFGFHLAASGGEDNPELTKAWLRIFPDWVLDWIAKTGALVANPRYAFAEDFKGHINLCPGSKYITTDMRKLVEPPEGVPVPGNEKIIFKPH
jgi:hypothetical protein